MACRKNGDGMQWLILQPHVPCRNNVTPCEISPRFREPQDNKLIPALYMLRYCRQSLVHCLGRCPNHCGSTLGRAFRPIIDPSCRTTTASRFSTATGRSCSTAVVPSSIHELALSCTRCSFREPLRAVGRRN